MGEPPIDADAVAKMVAARAAAAEAKARAGPKWVSQRWFERESMPRADWLTVQSFIQRHALRGL